MLKIRVKYYEISLSDLNIQVDDIERKAHVLGEMPLYDEFLQKELRFLNGQCQIRGGYVIVPAYTDKESIFINNVTFKVGRKIANFFKNANHVAIFVCTAGDAVSTRSKQLNANGDLVEAYLVDVLGSVMVENAMDLIQSRLIEEMKVVGMGCSNRYSPGYCSWNVNEQNQLFSFFDEGFCGVSLSKSCLMNPTKSVSGMIAIGEQMNFHDHVCNACNSRNCLYRDHSMEETN